jgi:pyridoxamine 5'-phosphate oxidase
MGNDMPTDPWQKFEEWFREAHQTSLADPNAMVVCNVDDDGHPDSRVVLCKEIRAEGLVFYTNYHSAKGTSLAHRPHCAINFFWDPIYKQVRMKGAVTPLAPAESERYWRSRTRDKQLSNFVSRQSTPLESREQMMSEIARADEQFKGIEVPRPSHWGGYVFHPTAIELWSGQKDRFHDRILYTKVQNGWKAQRLYP